MSKKLLVVLSFISLTAACATAVKSARDFSNIKLPPMEGTACQVHSDCPQGSACMHQVCVNMVHVACQSDLNCPEYEKCFDGVCKACGSDSDCSKDFQCNTNGVCVPKNTAVKHCNAASDCQNGEVCINGLCASFCYGINDQKGANKSTCLSQNNLYVGIDTNQMACSVSTSYDDKDLLEYSCDNHGVCLNNACYEVQCTEDSQCGDGKKCIKGECYKPECNDDSECYWGKKCIDYFCQECTQDSECSDNEKCLNQPEYSTIVYHQDGSMSGKISSIRQGKSCLQCTNDSHCGGDRPHCNLNNFECVACFNNSGCSAGEVCDDGLCRPECTQNNQCSSGICVDQVCYECNDNSDCNENDDDEKFCKLVTYKNGYSCSGKTCNYTRLEKPKKICTACAQDSDCSDGLVCGGSGVCVECFADRPCKEGYTCYANKCGLISKSETEEKDSKTACSAQSDCDNGYYCTIEHQCEPVAQKCTADADCGENGKCNHFGYCRAKLKTLWGMTVYPLCEEDAQCQSMGGAKCNPVAKKTYVSDKEVMARQCAYLCTTDYDCDNDESCIDGVCVSDENRHYCTSDEHCADGYKCNTLYRECVALPGSTSQTLDLNKAKSMMAHPELVKLPAECWRDSECSDGLVCLNGKCGCMTTNDCNEGQKCSEKHACVCTSDIGCGTGTFCQIPDSSFDEPKCLCYSDEACGSHEFCNQSGKCVKDDDSDKLYDHALDLQYGMTRAKDLKQAIELFEKADKLGHASALLQLGMLYYDNMDGNPDYVKKAKSIIPQGLEKVEKAKQQSEDDSYLDLAHDDPMYSMIHNMVRSYNSEEDQIKLSKARLMLDGFVLEKNESEALEILKSLADDDNYMAIYELANYYIKHDNDRKAVSIMKKSRGYRVDARSGYGMLKIAELVADNGFCNESAYSYIVSKLKTAAKLYNPEAAYQFSAFVDIFGIEYYFEKRKSEQELLTMAAQRGHKAAASRLAMLKANAEQITKLKDNDEYDKAADLGDIESCMKLIENNDSARFCIKALTNEDMIVGSYLNYKYNSSCDDEGYSFEEEYDDYYSDDEEMESEEMEPEEYDEY